MDAKFRSKCCFFLACIIFVAGAYAEHAASLPAKRISAGCGADYLKLHDERYSPVTYSGFTVPILLGYECRWVGMELKLGLQFLLPYTLSSQSEEKWHQNVSKPVNDLWQFMYWGEIVKVMEKFPNERIRPKAGIRLELEPINMSSDFVYLQKFASLYISLAVECVMTSRNILSVQASMPVVSYIGRINYSMRDIDWEFSSLRNSRGISAEIGYERTLTHFLHFDLSYVFSCYTYSKDRIGLKNASDRLKFDIVIVLGGKRA